jgi:hypothetical protein
MHSKSVADLSEIWRRMVVDFGRASLNPSSTHRKPAAGAAAPGAATVAASASG